MYTHTHTHIGSIVCSVFILQGDRRDEEEVRETDLSTVFDKTVTRYVAVCSISSSSSAIVILI